MDKKYAQLWQRLAAALKPQISTDSFNRWFSAVELVEATDKSLTLRVPNNIYQFWIESNYITALQNAIVTALGSPRAVKFASPSGTAGQTPLEDLSALKDRKSTRLNSSHPSISYAVFCLKKKTI